MKKSVLLIVILQISFTISAQDVEAFTLTSEWLAKIEKLIPSTTTNTETAKKNLLIFSLHTGFDHWTIPHTEAVINLIAKKTDGFNVTLSKDISMFEKKNLKKYDAIVLNNNCSIGDKRNLFWDVLKEDKALNDRQRDEKAKQLEQNLLNHIKGGAGLMVLHGGIVMQNKSEEFGKMVGGSFDYHPKQQEIHVKLVDATHPLVKGFDADGFTHIDEPYFFKNAYFDYDFRPLLYFEADKLEELKNAVEDNIKYVAWIKSYGKGRVFYSAPSHNAQSMENPQLLQFLTNGLQYASGNLTCDDSVLNN